MKMHHIAITVQNIKESIDWYTENLNAEVLFEDKTWGLVSVNGFKIAFVFKDMRKQKMNSLLSMKKNSKPIETDQNIFMFLILVATQLNFCTGLTFL